MRALACQCGEHLEGDDDELYGQVREHVDRDHPREERLTMFAYALGRVAA